MPIVKLNLKQKEILKLLEQRGATVKDSVDLVADLGYTLTPTKRPRFFEVDSGDSTPKRTYYIGKFKVAYSNKEEYRELCKYVTKFFNRPKEGLTITIPSGYEYYFDTDDLYYYLGRVCDYCFPQVVLARLLTKELCNR